MNLEFIILFLLGTFIANLPAHRGKPPAKQPLPRPIPADVCWGILISLARPRLRKFIERETGKLQKLAN